MEFGILGSLFNVHSFSPKIHLTFLSKSSLETLHWWLAIHSSSAGWSLICPFTPYQTLIQSFGETSITITFYLLYNWYEAYSLGSSAIFNIFCPAFLPLYNLCPDVFSACVHNVDHLFFRYIQYGILFVAKLILFYLLLYIPSVLVLSVAQDCSVWYFVSSRIFCLFHIFIWCLPKLYLLGSKTIFHYLSSMSCHTLVFPLFSCRLLLSIFQYDILLVPKLYLSCLKLYFTVSLPCNFIPWWFLCFCTACCSQLFNMPPPVPELCRHPTPYSCQF